MTTAHVENDRRPGVQTGYLQDDDGILVYATLYAEGNPAMD